MQTRHILSQVKLEVESPDLSSPWTTIYTVPVASALSVGSVSVSPKASSQLFESVVTKIVVCNRSSTIQTWWLLRLTSGVVGSSPFYLVRFKNLPVGVTDVASYNLALSSGDKLEVQALTPFASLVPIDVDVTVFGMEMVSGSGPSG